MATIRFLKGFDCLILETRGKSFYLTRDKPEWDFLFSSCIREGQEGSVTFDRPLPRLDIETLKREYFERGGQVGGKPDLKSIKLFDD